MGSLLWRRVVGVSGVATECFGIQATNGAQALHASSTLMRGLTVAPLSPRHRASAAATVAYPGNPGSAKYLVAQLRMIHLAMKGHVDVLAVSHAGHDGDAALAAASGNVLWSLQDQIQHKADFIRQYMLLPGRPPLIVAGHSIGAYMALHAVAMAEGDADTEAALPPVLQVLALFPFFWVDRTQWKIRFLRMAASCYELMGRVAHVLSLLPAWLQLALIRHFSSGTMDAASVEITRQLLTRSSLRNNFYMAHTEFRDLDQPPPWQMLRSLGRRLHVLCCPEDVWMTKNQYHEMKQQVDGLQVTWVEQVRHAYCTSPAQCQVVTSLMADILSQALVQQQQVKLPRWQQQQQQVADARSSEREAEVEVQGRREAEPVDLNVEVSELLVKAKL